MPVNDHAFDSAARGLLDDFAAAPPAHAWASIAAQLPARERRRAAWWWWAGALAVLFTAGLLAGQLLPTAPEDPGLIREQPLPQPEASLLYASSSSREDVPEPPAGEATEPSREARSHVEPSTDPPAADASRTPRLPAHEQSPAQTAVVAPIAQTVTPVPVASATRPIGEVDSEVLLTTTLTPRLPSASIPSMPLVRLRRHNEPSVGPIPCEDFRNRGDGWGLRVRAFGGAGPTEREWDYLEGVNPALDAYYIERDSVEELQLDIVGGLRVAASHGSGFAVRLGLDYQMYRSRVDFAGNRSTSTTIEEVRAPSGALIRTDTVVSTQVVERTVYNRQQTLTLVGGVGFHKWFGSVAPYVFAEAGYEILVGSRGSYPVLPQGETIELPDDDREFIAERPGLRLGGTVGLDIALGERWFVGPSVSYQVLGGLRGAGDPLSYDQTMLSGALNVGLRF